MKIRTQLGLSLSGMMTLSFLAAVVAVALVLKGMVLRQLYEEQKAQVEMLAAVSSQALALKDELFLLNYMKLLRSAPGVSYAYFVDPAEKILVHTSAQFVYKPLSQWQPAAAKAAAQEWESPVRLAGKVMGTARIGFSKEHTWKTLYAAWRKVLYPISAIAACGVALSLGLGLALAFYLSRSISHLAKAAEEIGRGNLAVEVPTDSSNELGELSRQFNYMAEQLRQLDQMKADFISMVSHDLRNPMGAIIAYADYLLSGEVGTLDAFQTRSVQVIRDQCRALTNMVNNILDMGKIQAGRMEFLSEPCDAGKILGDITKLFEFQAKRQGITLTTDLPADLPPVHGDAEKIQQIVTNLASNSLKFTRKGGVVLGAGEAPDKMIRLFVKDTGPGIPPEAIPRIFERFHQVGVKEQKQMKIRGTGLGLAISKGMVETMGGKIWVESQVGVGTTFFFTLPKAAATAAAGRT